MLNVKITTSTPETKVALGSGRGTTPPKTPFETIFDEVFPDWKPANENLDAFDYEAFLRREGLA